MNDDAVLPPGWVWATIGELASVGTGTTPSRTESQFWTDGNVPWITSSAVNLPAVLEAEQFISENALAATTLKVYPKGTLIIALYGEGKTRGKVSELRIDATINQALAALRLHTPGPEHRGFVRYFLQGNYAALRRQAAGGMQPNLNLSVVKRIRIPVAPLAEQGRIVSAVEELLSDLDAGVAALQRAKANLKRYRASVLKAAVEGKLTEEWRAIHPAKEPASALLARILKERRQKWEADQLTKFAAAGKEPPKNWREKYVEPLPPESVDLPTLPPEWTWATVAQLSTKVVDGVHRKPDYVATGIPFVTVRNLTAGPGISFERLNFIKPADHLEFIKRTNPETGDILVSKDGTLGVARAVRTSIPFSIFVSVALVKPVDRDSSDFLEMAISSPVVQRQMIGKGSGLQHIHLEDLRQDCIPIPPVQEQKEIVLLIAEKLSHIDFAEAEIDHSLQRAARLRQSILKQAFEGKLVPQDPAEEPARVLLERLRAGHKGECDVHRDEATSRRPRSGRMSPKGAKT